MNLVGLSWSYIKARPLNSFLNVTLMALGIAIIDVMVLLTYQLEQNLAKNAQGIDLVVGAKGSPLQIILSSIFQIDFPTGNISLEEANRITHNRMIKKAIPLAMGDSYQSFRIVGTNHDYVNHYSADLLQGDLWQKDMEVTIGSQVARKTGLSPGDTFFSVHGLGEKGSSHQKAPFFVKGILKPGNNVLDNLILTNVASVWEVHAKHSDEPQVQDPEEDLEITAVLVQFNSPMAAVQLPRLINQNSNLQSASPAFELARLFSLIGIGVDVLSGFAYLIIIIAALSIFIALYNSLKERKYDLAIMRSLGASKTKLFIHIALEGVLITVAGGVAGGFLGHVSLEIFARLFEQTGKSGLTGILWVGLESWIIAGSILVGLFSALIPALNAYRTDISKVLSQG